MSLFSFLIINIKTITSLVTIDNQILRKCEYRSYNGIKLSI